MPGAGDGAAAARQIHRGQTRVAGDRLERRARVRHGVGDTDPGVEVFFLTVRALGQRDGALAVGRAKTAIAGAAATATANPPARISRRAGNWKVAIVTLSVVIADRVVGRILWKLNEFCIHSTSSLYGCPALGAGADRRTRNGRWARGFRLFGQADARAAVPAGAWDAVDSRDVRVTRDGPERGEFGTSIGVQTVVYTSSSSPGVQAAIGGAEVARRGCGEDGDRRRRGNRERESTGKDQSSCWELEGRHRHAFFGLLTGQLLPATLPRSTGNLPHNFRRKWRVRAISVSVLSSCCGTAGQPPGTSTDRPPARAVMCKSSDASESERGGPPWRVPT